MIGLRQSPFMARGQAGGYGSGAGDVEPANCWRYLVALMPKWALNLRAK